MRSPGASPSSVRPEDPAVLAARKANYDLQRVERLAGNVGYLSLSLLSSRGSNEAFAAVDAAMAFLEHVDAMIIDLRRTAGGEPRMADYLASYFFEREGTPTLTSYMRAMDRTIARSTVKVNGRTRPAIPLFLLVGPGTASGGEDFAFIMKQASRATLVGSRSAGAGRLTNIYRVNDEFFVSVSGGRTFDPRSGKEWERSGIAPDIPEDQDALTTAHAAALAKLAASAADSASRSSLELARRALLARASAAKAAPQVLEDVTGEYDLRLVTADNGRLWYRRDRARPAEELVPIEDYAFVLGESTRVEFIRDGGRVTAMRITPPAGPSLTFPKTR